MYLATLSTLFLRFNFITIIDRYLCFKRVSVFSSLALFAFYLFFEMLCIKSFGFFSATIFYWVVFGCSFTLIASTLTYSQLFARFFFKNSLWFLLHRKIWSKIYLLFLWLFSRLEMDDLNIGMTYNRFVRAHALPLRRSVYLSTINICFGANDRNKSLEYGSPSGDFSNIYDYYGYDSSRNHNSNRWRRRGRKMVNSSISFFKHNFDEK